MSPIIEIQNLLFRYPNNSSDTLNLPEFTVKSGEKIFLHGPSGSGKSTLLEILAGVLSPTQGNLKILNENLSSFSSSAKDLFRANHIGYIFQSFNLISYLTVTENISLPLHFSPLKRKKVPRNNEKETIAALTQDLGISELINKRVAELSVGQQQRVAVARALIGSPEIILADEPTSALDHDHREKFIKLLFMVADKSKITVIFVSHDKTLEKIFDRTVSLLDLNKVGQQ